MNAAEHIEGDLFDVSLPTRPDVDPLQADWEAMEDRASTLWPIPFRKRTCIKLKGILKEFKGVIRLARRPAVWEPRQKLHLRIGHTPFTTDDIEQCTVVE
jgi:hypothetical protein